MIKAVFENQVSLSIGWSKGSSRRALCVAGLLVVLTVASRASAQAGDDDSIGWGQDDTEPTPSSTQAPSSKQIYFGGYLRSDWAMGVRRLDDTPLAKGRQSVDLEFRVRQDWLRVVLGVHGMYDVAYRVERGQYSQPIRDTYEWLVRFRESYFSFVGERVELTLGMQKTALGSGELLSVLDVLNPKDDREPGLTDLEDRRLPVLMSKLSVFWKRHRLEFIGVHEGFFRLRPPPLAPFSPFRKIVTDDSNLGGFVIGPFGQDVDFKEDAGRFAAEYNQALARWTYSGSKVDLGLYAGSIIEYPGVADWDSTMLSVGTRIGVKHPRYTMFGFSFAKPLGQWLIHAEVAADIDRAVQVASLRANPFSLSFERRHLFRWLAGLRYTRLGGAVFTVEYMQGSVGDIFQDAYDAELLLPINPAILSARWQQTLGEGRHSFELVGAIFGPHFSGGGIARAQLTHELHDAVHLTWGYVGYFPGKERSLIYGFEKNDRVFARLRWDFAIE